MTACGCVSSGVRVGWVDGRLFSKRTESGVACSGQPGVHEYLAGSVGKYWLKKKGGRSRESEEESSGMTREVAGQARSWDVLRHVRAVAERRGLGRSSGRTER